MIDIAPSFPGDLPEILAMSRAVGVFSGEEVDTVDELFRGYQTDAVKSGYNFLSARKDGRLAGFACWGPTFLSHGTVDLYWICTDKVFQGQGIASALFRAVEKNARSAGRWQLVIWTSSKPDYAQARQFYLKMGCTLAAQIADFYDRGDDLCVFIDNLDSSPTD